MAEYYNTPSNASGFPKYYANWDEQFWVVAPTPDQQYAITLAYIKQPTSITTSDSQTTDLSNKYEDLLLYASLVESIWILERSCRYVKFLSAVLSRSFGNLCFRATRPKKKGRIYGRFYSCSNEDKTTVTIRR